MSEFKENLKNHRLGKSMTQDALAKKTGLTPEWISHFETGRRKPSLNNLVKLADALQITLDELVGR